MKIKKNTFSTLVLELFFPSIANCKKLKIQKIQKSTSPIVNPDSRNLWILIVFLNPDPGSGFRRKKIKRK
jgi:hypothetical protein